MESRFQNWKQISDALLRVHGFYSMHEGCFLQTRFSKILNVSIEQKTRPSICFKTWGQAFETLSQAFEALSRAFETLCRAFGGLGEN